MEVAGLVIAVVPLMITALKQYTDARRGWRQFRRTSLYLSRLIQALREQSFLLETDLQQLLRAAGSEDDIMNDDRGERQAFVLKSDVATKIAAYMGKAYDPYVQALGLCEESVKEVVKRIWKCVPGCESGSLAGVVEANKSKNGKSTFLRRIKLSLDKSEIEGLVGDIESASKRLRRLSKCAILVHDMRSESTKVSKFTKFLQSIRTQADRLYWVVAESLSSCYHNEHDTKLLLNDRLEQFITTQKPISFSLAIISPSEVGSRSRLSHSIQINVLEDEVFSTDHLHSRVRKVTFTKNLHQFTVRSTGFTKTPERRLPDKRAVKRQMLELGVLLLEIWHETSLEIWAASVGLTIQSSYGSRYDAARKWLSESDTVLVSYWDAIDRCIECDFPALSDWQDSAFRKSVCEGVVKPLCHNSSCFTD
ncbi:hypothetical protein JMJ35_008754 [Cladonia borealis]|uniref:Uncharacterized protein n=1 Tax=Cladonia borealis TaxID=184061 RepID=A0AA39QVH8_9LECA|nr:hypothetical protein JMJ35_008754 [Cladonia borealis]